MIVRFCLGFGLTLACLTVASPLTQASQISFQVCQLAYETPPNAECGRLQVPEDPSRPEGRTIALNVMRVPALQDKGRSPLFVVVGGPGGAAVRSARQYLGMFRQLQQERDIVFVDQRGTGESNGLKCAFTELHFGEGGDEQRLQQARQELAACVADLDAELAFYTTPYAVQDLERLRQALGYKQLNLWGVSYGTRVILEYMRQYRQAVRAAVLDGVAPVSLQLPRFTEQDASRALKRIFDVCRESEGCARAYGDLASAWLALLGSLEEAPREITLTHPRSQAPVTVNLSATVLSGWVRLALYSRELAPLLPQAIARAVAGDFTVLGSVALLAVEDISEQVSQGMQMIVLCAEDQNHPKAEVLGFPAEHTRWLRLDHPEVFASFCAQLPPAKVPESYYEPVHSEVPTLLLSGEFDPVTPPRWAERVAAGLPNSLHLVAPGAHHGVTMHGCTARIVQDFIAAGSVSAIDAACIKDIQPQAFFIDAAGPAMSKSTGYTEVEND